MECLSEGWALQFEISIFSSHLVDLGLSVAWNDLALRLVEALSAAPIPCMTCCSALAIFWLQRVIASWLI